MPIVTEAAADGIRYIASPNGKSYRSLHYHRSPGGRRKSIWILARHDEFALFCRADEGGWYDASGYWGFGDGARQVVGARHERMAFFPTKSEGTDDWHGYPLRLSPVRRPEPDLADTWVAAKLVSFVVGEKIKRGKI